MKRKYWVDGRDRKHKHGDYQLGELAPSCIFIVEIFWRRKMSDRKLFGVLSGAQVTLLGALAIIAPGAVYAVTYTSVVVTDPTTGRQGLVDAGRRFYVYDPIAGYANNPFNYIEFTGSAPISITSTIYTVPPGKALILKSANFTLYNGVSGSDNYIYLFDAGNFITGFDEATVAGSHVGDLGNGYYVHSGENVTVHANAANFFSLEGYLVPSSAVPASGSAEAAEQVVRVGGHPIK